jgi:5-methylcytosine-specific restriction endonuclease McrA
MLKVFVLDKNKNPLMPCHPARAREFLKKGKAKVFKLKPFTIILIERDSGNTQPIEIKIDPGSKKTGIALVGDFKRGKNVLFAVNLEHRGYQIKKALDSRRAIRRSRRNRKTRYRPSRFDNRRRPNGWLPPSLISRVHNVINWAKKLIRFSPISDIAVETVRFDTQKMQNPEISGVEYQQGELFGYEIRQYLLEKWLRTCAYCDAKDVALEIEHIIPKSKGGSNRVSNLTLSCNRCNIKKANQSVEQFVKDKSRLKKILAKAKAPLRDAAAVNATRYAIGNRLKTFDLPISFWSGGRTKYNRTHQGYSKDHWIDAVCVGQTGRHVTIPKSFQPLNVKAEGRSNRQMCRMDRYGFPRTSAKSQKRVKGFQTGDIIKAIVPSGKKTGTYVGRVAVRSSGSFNIKCDKKTIQGIGFKYCNILQRIDGYSYA